MVASEGQGDALRITIDEAFDSQTALDVRDAMARHPSVQHVLLDFFKLRIFSNLAVALVAPVLAKKRVTLRGLTLQEARTFERFGVGRRADPATDARSL